MNLIVNRVPVDSNINLINKNVLLRTEDEKDFIVLYRSTINLHNHNVVITSENDQNSLLYLMDKFQLYNYNYGLVQSRKNKSIHLLTDEFIIVLHSPIIERLDFEDDKILKMNIISDYIEPFFQPNTYIRRAKLEKIMQNIRWKVRK